MARKLGLDLDQVVGAAVAVADAEGLEAVSLARVAAALGVRSPSLYSHVDGLAGLRRAMALDAARRLGAELAASMAKKKGPAAVRAMAGAYRAFARRHPGAYATILTTPTEEDDQEVYAVFAEQLPPIVAVVEGMGVPPSEAVDVIRALRSAIHGFVSLETSGGFGLPGDLDRAFARMIDLLIAGMTRR